jgi:hypothetical protein
MPFFLSFSYFFSFFTLGRLLGICPPFPESYPLQAGLKRR